MSRRGSREYLPEARRKWLADRQASHNLLQSIAYILTIGVSGLVLCAVGSNLSNIANNVGMRATLLGGRAFMWRGIGAILGSIASSSLYKVFEGDIILLSGLLSISCILSIIPYSLSSLQVYFLFFGLGVCSSINDTGCNIMMRRLHRKNAGPWLGANGISFGTAAAIVPVVELMTRRLSYQYHILSVLIVFIGVFLMYSMSNRIDPTYGIQKIDESTIESAEKGEQMNHTDKVNKVPEHYNVEVVIGLMVFCFVGGQVDMAAYAHLYLDQTEVIKSPSKSSVLLVFWVFVGIGRLLGMIDQRSLGFTSDKLISHLTYCCLLGSVSLLLPWFFPSSPILLWVSVASYACFYGPCVAYCHDLNNRLTLPTEKSTSIIMLGINSGASFVPYITSAVWEANHNPSTLIVAIALSMAIPILLAKKSQSLSYNYSFASLHKQ
jgi:fucose permease